jgi:hypothetical protein
MDQIFPTGFPLATGFYLVFYVFTLIIHVVLMNYVLAGTGYVAVARLLTLRGSERPTGIMTATLTDWLPFALSGAITAGVAPLLFLQILYKESFYTANLLLFNRWMSILPVLIVGFYLLYLWKSRPAGRWPMIVRAFIGLVAFGCFAFTGYSWTENHVLSMQGQAVWADVYSSDRVVYWNPHIVPRLLVWYAGSLPTMVTLVGWQLWGHARRDKDSVSVREARRATLLALVGLLVAGVCGAIYYRDISAGDRAQFHGPLAGPYFYAAIGGVVIQAGSWLWQFARGRLCTGALTAATIGMTVTVAGMTVVREAIRLKNVDLAVLMPLHAKAFQMGGFFVFFAFFVLAGVATAATIVLVRKALRSAPAAT